MAAHGGFRLLELGPGKTWSVKSLLLPKDYLQSLEKHVLLGFSGISRTAEQHARNKVDNIKQGKTTKELQAITVTSPRGIAGFSKAGQL